MGATLGHVRTDLRALNLSRLLLASMAARRQVSLWRWLLGLVRAAW
jgi:hypothetical protein